MFVLATAAAWGQVTSLVTVPVADTLGEGELEIGYQADGVGLDPDRPYSHSATLVYGVTDRLEIGFDTDFLGTVRWAAKAQVWTAGGDGDFALSLGALGVQGQQSTPFVVGRAGFGRARVHVGWMREDISRGFFGFDAEALPGLTLAMDYTSGGSGAVSAGAFVAIPGVDGLTGSVGYSAPNDRSAEAGHFIGLSFAVRL